MEYWQIPKIHHQPECLLIEQMLPQRFAVTGAEPFIGGDEGGDAAGPEEFVGAGVKIDVEVGPLGVDTGEAFAQDGFLRLDQLHAHIRRIGHDDVEAASADGARGGGVFLHHQVAEQGAFFGIGEEDFGILDGPVEAVAGEVGLLPEGEIGADVVEFGFEAGLFFAVGAEVGGFFVAEVFDGGALKKVLGRGGGKGVADLDLEIEIGQGRRDGAFELDGEGEPEAQAGDVDSKGVFIDSIEVALDDLEAALVGGLGIGLLAGGKDAGAEVEQLVEHAEQVGPGAAGGVADLDRDERPVHSLGVVKGGGVVLMDKSFEGGAGLAGAAVGEVLDEGGAGHEGDDGLGRVVAALLVATGDEFFKHLAEHLGIDGNLDFQRGAFGHGEVVAGEETALGVENEGDGLIGHAELGQAVGAVFGVFKESAVEVGHGAEARIGGAGGAVGLVQALEEQGDEAVGVKVGGGGGAVTFARVVVPKRGEVVGAIPHLQPAFALDEGEEHEAVEEPLGEEAEGLFPGKGGTDMGFHGIEDAAVVAVKLLEERFDLKGFDEVRELGALAKRAQQLEAFEGGAAGLAGAEEVGVAAGRGFVLLQLAVGGEGVGAGGKGEAVVRGSADKESEHGVGAFLANVAGDELAQARAVALQIHLTADADFEHGDGAVVGQGDPGELHGGADRLGGKLEGLRLRKDLNRGQE